MAATIDWKTLLAILETGLTGTSRAPKREVQATHRALSRQQSRVTKESKSVPTNMTPVSQERGQEAYWLRILWLNPPLSLTRHNDPQPLQNGSVKADSRRSMGMVESPKWPLGFNVLIQRSIRCAV